jgi:two-component system LytT family response regulator
VTHTVLVVDDERLARSSVVRHLASLLPDARVHEARDGVEALEKIASCAPDIVLLDVEMPELSGLDVLRHLAPPRPKIVFVTAYAHFAAQAFEQNACDYLVKPFTAERFGGAMRRAIAELDVEAKLAGLEGTLARAGRYLERLALPSLGKIDVVRADRIECLRSEGRHTYVHADGREHVSELSLLHFEGRLDPAAFVRVHRTALVSLAHVARVHLDVDPPSVELRSGMRLTISRRHRAALRDLARG